MVVEREKWETSAMREWGEVFLHYFIGWRCRL